MYEDFFYVDNVSQLVGEFLSPVRRLEENSLKEDGLTSRSYTEEVYQIWSTVFSPL